MPHSFTKTTSSDGRWTLQQSSPERGAAVWVIHDGQVMADRGSWTQVRETMRLRLAREALLFPELARLRKQAAAIHKSQRYGSLPYAFHLAAVEAVLHRFDVATSARVIAAWYHDAPEDQGYTADMLRALHEELALGLANGRCDEHLARHPHPADDWRPRSVGGARQSASHSSANINCSSGAGSGNRASSGWSSSPTCHGQ